MRNETPLTDARCADSQKLQTMAMRWAWMCDLARNLERELNEARAALTYIDRQVREVWSPTDTYQSTHREWCIDEARKVLTPLSSPPPVAGDGKKTP